jgi:hypothetical protein
MFNNSQQGRGRVSKIQQPNTSKLFQMYERVSYSDNTEDLQHSSTSPLSVAYFSSQNMKIIHNGIRAGVYEKTDHKYIIDNQDIDQLKFVMRSVFTQHAMHNTTNIPQQIESLNKIVLNYCIHQITTELTSYLKYIHDISTMYVPNDHPVDVNKYRDLEYHKDWFSKQN